LDAESCRRADSGLGACGNRDRIAGPWVLFNNHGTLTVTDRAGFLAGVRILVRVFASPPIAVLSLILVAYQLLNQRERSQLHA
jgi:hypothetical protein